MIAPVPINPSFPSKFPPKCISKSSSQPQTEDSSSETEVSFCLLEFLPPPMIRTLPLFYSHRLEGDLLLFDRAQLNERGESRGLLSKYNSCKRIVSASFDSITGITSFGIENFSNNIFTPFELMVQRLDSQSDKNAHRLAKKLLKMGEFVNSSREIFGKTNQGLRKFQRNDKKFRDYQNKNKEIIESNRENLIITFLFKFSKRTNDFEVSEISFNEKFREVVGFEDNSDFSKSIIRRGFPDSVFIEENYHNWYSRMIHNSFGRLAEPNRPKEPMMVLIQGRQFEKEAFDMDVEMNKLELEGYFEMSMHLVFRKHEATVLTAKRRYQWEPPVESKPKTRQIYLQSAEPEEIFKESQFVNQFYPEALVKKVKVEARECGYRLL